MPGGGSGGRGVIEVAVEGEFTLGNGGPGVLGSRAWESVAAMARAVGFGQPESEAPAAEIPYTSS